jgi:hypothetical protein
MLAEHHSREPLALGLSREEVRERLFGQVRSEIFRAVVARLGEEGKITAERDALRLSSHRPALTGSDKAAKKNLEDAFRSAGLQARTLEETAAATGIKIEFARKLYNLIAGEKRIVKIGDFVFHVDSIEDLKSRVRARKPINPKMDILVFKEITGGLTRKYAIPLLEYLDRELLALVPFHHFGSNVLLTEFSDHVGDHLLAGSAQARGVAAQHVEHQLGVAMHQRRESHFAQDGDVAGSQRAHRGRARARVDQRHLADDLAGLAHLQAHFGAARMRDYLNLASQNNITLVPFFALPEQHLAGLEAFIGHVGGQLLQIEVGEALEERQCAHQLKHRRSPRA